jgi:hypothetical protein
MIIIILFENTRLSLKHLWEYVILLMGNLMEEKARLLNKMSYLVRVSSRGVQPVPQHRAPSM